MKNNIFFVFNTLFSSVKAQETDRDQRDYWIAVSLMVISTNKGSNFHSSRRTYFFQGQLSELKKTEACIWVYSVFPCVEFSGLNAKGVTFCCSYLSLGRPGTLSSVSSEFKVCCVQGKSSAAAGALDLTATLLTFEDNRKEKSREKAVCQTSLWCQKYTTVKQEHCWTLHIQIHIFSPIFKQI